MRSACAVRRVARCIVYGAKSGKLKIGSVKDVSYKRLKTTYTSPKFNKIKIKNISGNKFFLLRIINL